MGFTWTIAALIIVIAVASRFLGSYIVLGVRGAGQVAVPH